MRLAERYELPALVGEHVHLPTSKGGTGAFLVEADAEQVFANWRFRCNRCSLPCRHRPGLSRRLAAMPLPLSGSDREGAVMEAVRRKILTDWDRLLRTDGAT
uniref:hypothetical protein n=1 Tax=Streptomyces aureocirculatus TaxID=67275 RepID=UPI0013315702